MDNLDKNHCIVLQDGRFDLKNGTGPEDLKSMFNQITAAKPDRIVIHFHGGLIDRLAGINAANFLRPIYEEAGAFPIFVVWETGWREVIQNNLPAIFNEDIFQKIQMRVAQFAKAKLEKSAITGVSKGLGGLDLPKDSAVQQELDNPVDGREPFANVNPRAISDEEELTDEERRQFEDKLNGDPRFQMAVAEIAASMPADDTTLATSRGATVRSSAKTLMSPDVLKEMATDETGAKGLISTAIMAARCAMILARVIQRFAQRRDHGFYLTVTEEILRAFYVGNAGKFLWDGMKKEVDDAFGFEADCGGNALLGALQQLWKPDYQPKITLVGHSAGSIYACRLLQEVEKRKLPDDMKFNVVLIAPACTFTVLANALRDAGDRIVGLRVFGMGDEWERKDAIVKVLYPSSLLYFVSGVIEEERDCPLAGMARYYSAPYDEANFADIKFVRDFTLFRKDHALIWSTATEGDGFNCDMTSHGGWAGAAATVASVQHIIGKGYDYAAGAGGNA